MTKSLMGPAAAALLRTMNYTTRRHSILASNVANIDTPGYIPADLVFSRELNGALKLSTDNPGQIGAEPEIFEQVLDLTTTPGIDGNAVDLDREMAKMTANSQRFSLASRLISKKVALLRYTIDEDR